MVPATQTAWAAEPACPANLPPLSIGIRPPRPRGGFDAEGARPRKIAPPVDLFATIGKDDAWDEPFEPEQPKLPLNCTFGPKSRVATLELHSFDATLSMTLDQTMSADTAMHGLSGMKWVRGENIGAGSMGVVFRALLQDTGQVIAVKEVNIDTDDAADVLFKEQLANEVDICKDLKHPRIVQYLGHDDIDGHLYIYLEYCVGGSMSCVLKQFGAFEESLIQVYTRGLLEGLVYLHGQKPPVVHRDIKGANILVGMDSQVKWADFGCSKRTCDTLNRTMKGSIPWMAPEVITGSGSGRRADIWSFGCVLIEMATASTPWGKLDNPMAAMMKIGMSKEVPQMPVEGISEDCRSFAEACLQRDKTKRPYADALLAYPFVDGLLLDDM